jgi:hypothetical protein
MKEEAAQLSREPDEAAQLPSLIPGGREDGRGVSTL